MIGRRRFLAISATALVSGRALAQTGPKRWRGVALGADAEIVLNGPSDQIAPALKDALAVLRRIEDLFSLYEAGSWLSRLNSEGQVRGLPDEVSDLLDDVSRAHRDTGGLFDPTVQALWTALGEDGDLSAARGQIGWDKVRHRGDSLRLAPGQTLTLNGIAQGFATDRVSDVLRSHGLTQVLVNIGEFRGTGGPWRVGVADPSEGVILSRTLRDGAIATSSPGATLIGGTPHILHPADGRPQWSTVSVEASTATRADALSTALCLADLDGVRALRPGLTDVSRVTLIDRAGDVTTV